MTSQTHEQTDKPDEAYDIALDHHGPEFRERPHEILDELRSRCPVAHSSEHGGYWILSDYESVHAAARADDLFSSAETVGIPPSGWPFPILPIESDPPLTQKLREITLSAFSPGAAADLRPMMREIATDLIDAFIERGECDIVDEFTIPMPARVILRMLGIDDTAWRSWAERVHTVVHGRAHDPENAMQAGTSLFTELGEEMQRRRDMPADADLYARIVHGRIDGEPLGDIQITMYGILMMLGGMDTTAGLTGNTLLRLCERPELRRRLIEDGTLLPSATEEFLRHDTPVLGLGRTVTRDQEFRGRHLRQGEHALLMWAAANRDPAVFENPDEIDFDRANKRHVSFGVGAHRCLGSNIARQMFQVMIEEVLTRLPDFRLAGEPAHFADAGEVYAVRHLPIAFTPGPRSQAPASD